MENLKIKDNVNLDNLLNLGFEKVDYSNENGLEYLGIQYEAKDYYPIEENGSQYEDDKGYNYRSMITIGKNRLVFIEVLNNDCSYHIEGSEMNFIANMIYKLTILDMLEMSIKGEK